MNLLRKMKSRFYVPGADDRPWADAFKRLLYRRIPDFPRTLQIQTATGCNAACVFCPYSESHDKVPKGRMPEELFDRIVDEIARNATRPRISPYLMNEPFLDASLIEKARHIRRSIPRCKLVVTTNAGRLDAALVDNLLADNPFDDLYISMQGIEKEPYEESMRGRLVFENTLANVEHLIDACKRSGSKMDITITMIKTRLVDADKAVAHWQSRGIKAKYTSLENRGGNTRAFKEINPGGKKHFKHCTRLFKQAYILFNGDMVLCCTDYYKKMVLGNVGETSIRAVWNSPRAIEIRRDFIRADYRNNPLCASCFISDID
jgi:radical SAM protein with 4Fe4S-binding SPASM domain